MVSQDGMPMKIAWQYYRENLQRLPMFVIYDHPPDFPDHFVARLHFSLPQPEPTGIAFAHETLDGLRGLIPPECACLTRMPDDDPSIVEIWL